jgi:hypothetical protein
MFAQNMRPAPASMRAVQVPKDARDELEKLEKLEKSAKAAAVEGGLKERPLPRLLQQLYRKKFTGYFVITDQTGDQSEVYMREGAIVHVGRPVDTDRLDNLLVEYGLVPAEIVARASLQVTEGMRLGEVLDRMGVLDKVKLSQVLKSQVLRKLTRLFFVADGSYAVYVQKHSYGEGADLALMRVDPRTVIYPGIRAAYDLPRATQELTRLLGQRFRLGELSPGFIAALGVPTQDSTVESLHKGWLTLAALDAVTARPLEVRSIVLALYYCDALEREPLVEAASDSAREGEAGLGPAEPDRGKVWKPVEGFHLNREGEAGLGPAEPDRGKVWKPVEGFHLTDTGASLKVVPEVAAPQASQAPPKPVSTPAQIRPNVSGETVQAIPVKRPPTGSFVVVPSVAAAAGTAPRPSSAPTAESPRAAILEMAQKLDRLNHFEALGVSPSATPAEISIAFVRAARQFHPDRLSSVGLQDLRPAAERILARINEASMVLGDPARRADYVASLNAGPQAASASLPTVLEAENWFLKGEVSLKKGEHGRAIECFTMATQGNPSEPQYRAYLAWARFDDPRTRKETIVRETLKVMESVVQERPRFARGHYWTGLLWKFLNETIRSERAFREAVNVDSGFIDASRELRLIDMRKSKSPAGKPEPPRGGLMGKFFKK